MTFYKLTSIDNGKDIYINPNLIVCYFDEDNNDSNLKIIFNSGDYATVSKFDFTNMLILEGIDEYWQQQTPLTAYQLTTKIKLFYYLSL